MSHPEQTVPQIEQQTEPKNMTSNPRFMHKKGGGEKNVF